MERNEILNYTEKLTSKIFKNFYETAEAKQDKKARTLHKPSKRKVYNRLETDSSEDEKPKNSFKKSVEIQTENNNFLQEEVIKKDKEIQELKKLLLQAQQKLDFGVKDRENSSRKIKSHKVELEKIMNPKKNSVKNREINIEEMVFISTKNKFLNESYNNSSVGSRSVSAFEIKNKEMTLDEIQNPKLSSKKARFEEDDKEKKTFDQESFDNSQNDLKFENEVFDSHKNSFIKSPSVEDLKFPEKIFDENNQKNYGKFDFYDKSFDEPKITENVKDTRKSDQKDCEKVDFYDQNVENVEKPKITQNDKDVKESHKKDWEKVDFYDKDFDNPITTKVTKNMEENIKKTPFKTPNETVNESPISNSTLLTDKNVSLTKEKSLKITPSLNEIELEENMNMSDSGIKSIRELEKLLEQNENMDYENSKKKLEKLYKNPASSQEIAAETFTKKFNENISSIVTNDKRNKIEDSNSKIKENYTFEPIFPMIESNLLKDTQQIRENKSGKNPKQEFKKSRNSSLP